MHKMAVCKAHILFLRKAQNNILHTQPLIGLRLPGPARTCPWRKFTL